MTYEQMMGEMDEIVELMRRLANAKENGLSLAEIVQAMAAVQVRQQKLIAHAVLEVERLKAMGGKA